MSVYHLPFCLKYDGKICSSLLCLYFTLICDTFRYRLVNLSYLLIRLHKSTGTLGDSNPKFLPTKLHRIHITVSMPSATGLHHCIGCYGN